MLGVPCCTLLCARSPSLVCATRRHQGQKDLGRGASEALKRAVNRMMLSVPYLNLTIYPSLEGITLSIICLKILLDQEKYVNVS